MDTGFLPVNVCTTQIACLETLEILGVVSNQSTNGRRLWFCDESHSEQITIRWFWEVEQVLRIKSIETNFAAVTRDTKLAYNHRARIQSPITRRITELVRAIDQSSPALLFFDAASRKKHFQCQDSIASTCRRLLRNNVTLAINIVPPILAFSMNEILATETQR